MRYIFLLFLLSLTISCSTWKNVPERLDKFVANAENSASTYDSDDWEKSLAQYEDLIATYKENKDKYTPDQRDMVFNAVGRYHILLLKNGILETASLIETIKAVIPAYIQGLGDGIKDNVLDISSSLKGLFDFSGIEESLNGLGDVLSSVVDSLAASSENY